MNTNTATCQPHTCAAASYFEHRLAVCQIELAETRRQLAAERGRNASLQRQLALGVDAVSVSMISNDFDEPTRNDRPRRAHPVLVRRSDLRTRTIEVRDAG